jgi:HD domain
MISRRPFLRSISCGCCVALAAWWRRTAGAAEPPKPVLQLPNAVAGIRIPDSRLARDAAQRAYDESPLFLFNHCMRSFAFASVLARGSGWNWDAEVVFVAAALHDLGLLPEHHDAFKTFEAAGADLARGFAVAHGMAEPKADWVRDGIALHTTSGGKSPVHEVAMINMGTGLDVLGSARWCDKLPAAARTEILAAFPRLSFSREFRQTLEDYKNRHPGDAGEGNWIASLPPTPFENRCLDG